MIVKNKKKLKIVYEDEKVLVVDKPHGQLTIATLKKETDTLYHQVSIYLKGQLGSKARIFIVHRLDKDTSGLIIFAKSYQVKKDLQALFEQGIPIRGYQGIVSNKPTKEEDELVTYLSEDKFGNVFLSSKSNRYAKKCLTSYKVKYVDQLGYHLEIYIKTGRKNQIRLALSSIGCPLLGDKKFNGKSYKYLCLDATYLDLSAYDKRYVFHK